MKLLVRKMNDMRKQARTHITRLRNVYTLSQGNTEKQSIFCISYSVSCSIFVFSIFFFYKNNGGSIQHYLTNIISTYNYELPAKDKEREAELLKHRAYSEETKELIINLKDDNSRKARLLSKMKEAKLADNENLDKWEKQATESEVTVKR